MKCMCLLCENEINVKCKSGKVSHVVCPVCETEYKIDSKAFNIIREIYNLNGTGNSHTTSEQVSNREKLLNWVKENTQKGNIITIDLDVLKKFGIDYTES